MYILHMNSNEKKTWVSPEVKDLGDAKDIMKGFTPGDPKVPGGGDGALAGASDAYYQICYTVYSTLMFQQN